MRIFVAVGSDKHAGHQFGLLNPETELVVPEFDPGAGLTTRLERVTLNESQKLLWNWTAGDISNILDKVGDSPLHVVDNGDPTNGNYFKDQQNLTGRVSDQITMAADTLAPWGAAKRLEAYHIIIGTGVHEFGLGSASLLMSDKIRLRFPTVPASVKYHSLLTVDGVQFDISHHGPGPGARTWLRGNVARYYLQDRMIEELLAGRIPPRVYVRGDKHEYVQETVTRRVGEHTVKSTICICPPLSFVTDHARKVMQSPPRVTVGMLLFEVRGGQFVEQVGEYLHTLDARQEDTYAYPAPA